MATINDHRVTLDLDVTAYLRQLDPGVVKAHDAYTAEHEALDAAADALAAVKDAAQEESANIRAAAQQGKPAPKTSGTDYWTAREDAAKAAIRAQAVKTRAAAETYERALCDSAPIRKAVGEAVVSAHAVAVESVETARAASASLRSTADLFRRLEHGAAVRANGARAGADVSLTFDEVHRNDPGETAPGRVSQAWQAAAESVTRFPVARYQADTADVVAAKRREDDAIRQHLLTAGRVGESLLRLRAAHPGNPTLDGLAILGEQRLVLLDALAAGRRARDAA